MTAPAPLTPQALDGLEEKARAAMPGDEWSRRPVERFADAVFIAALSPSTALALIAAARAGEEMREALEKIERWSEFPETGRFWPNDDGTESDRPMSYGAMWGSNGERDYMRHIARTALSKEQPQ